MVGDGVSVRACEVAVGDRVYGVGPAWKVVRVIVRQGMTRLYWSVHEDHFESFENDQAVRIVPRG